MTYWQQRGGDIVIKIRVQPRASRNAIAGVLADALKIKLTAPPVGGAANKMCLAFLASELGVGKTAVQLISGHKSRTKQLLVRLDPDVAGKVTPAEMRARIEALANPRKTP